MQPRIREMFEEDAQAVEFPPDFLVFLVWSAERERPEDQWMVAVEVALELLRNSEGWKSPPTGARTGVKRPKGKGGQALTSSELSRLLMLRHRYEVQKRLSLAQGAGSPPVTQASFAGANGVSSRELDRARMAKNRALKRRIE